MISQGVVITRVLCPPKMLREQCSRDIDMPQQSEPPMMSDIAKLQGLDKPFTDKTVLMEPLRGHRNSSQTIDLFKGENNQRARNCETKFTSE